MFYVPGNSTSVVLGNLQPDTQYSLTVAATVAGGRRSRSRPVVFKTMGKSQLYFYFFKFHFQMLQIICMRKFVLYKLIALRSLQPSTKGAVKASVYKLHFVDRKHDISTDKFLLIFFFYHFSLAEQTSELSPQSGILNNDSPMQAAGEPRIKILEEPVYNLSSNSTRPELPTVSLS